MSQKSKAKKHSREGSGFRYSLILFCLFGILLTGYTLYHTFHTETFNADIYPHKGTVTDEFYISMTTSKGTWNNPDTLSPAKIGAEYDGVINYNGSDDLRNWTLVFEVPVSSFIDSSWNGEYVNDTKTGVITVTPLDYNYEIAADSKEEFGFVMYAPDELDIEHFSFSGEKIVRPWKKPIFWLLVIAMFTVMVIGITTLITNIRYKQMQEKLAVQKMVTDQALQTFAKIIDAKDEYTCGHSLRVAIYSRELASRYGLSEDECEQVYYMALLHDIGKIGIPDNILSKNGKLTDEEWAKIKTHVTIGAGVLADFSAVPGISDGAKYHHERFDGSGYCFGLHGTDIPLKARIIAVADAYDAMSSARVYRPAIPPEQIYQELKKNSGVQFDAVIARLMMEMIDDGFAPVL